MTENKYEHLKGKRIAAIDYGRRRVGFAVCDEFHITTSPRGIFILTDDDFWEKLNEALDKENAAAVVLGVPLRHDNEETDLIKEIYEFQKELEKRFGIEVITYDEAFSSKRAEKTMLEIGTKKKKRAKKGTKDEFAAAIILRDFLNSIEF